MSTITKRNNTYRIRVSSGYDSSGKQIMQSMTWKPDPGMTKKQIEKEVQRQAVLFEEKVLSGQFIKGDIKFSEFANQWLATYGKEHLKPATYKSYAEQMQRINAAIGHIPLNKLQPHHIISFYDNLKEKGIRDDLKYSTCVDFKKQMKDKRITQQALSQMSGLSINTIRVCGNGHNISAHSAQAISRALEQPLTALFKPQQDKATLSGTTLLYHHRVLSSILSTAVHWQVIASNPCARVKPPKAEKKEARYLDEQQAQAVIDYLESEPLQFKALITLLLYSGMRRGEVCGLTWNDIDFENNLIDINKANLYLPGKGVFESDTKNTSSQRIIKIPSPAVELLRQYRAEQSAERLRAGDQWQNTGKVFTQWNGAPIHPDTITRRFHDFIERNDLPDVTIHSLRHTNATLLIANGADIKTVSKRLGHANVTTTGNIYTHAIKTADEMAAETLQGLFMSGKTKKA